MRIIAINIHTDAKIAFKRTTNEFFKSIFPIFSIKLLKSKNTDTYATILVPRAKPLCCKNLTRITFKIMLTATANIPFS